LLGAAHRRGASVADQAAEMESQRWAGAEASPSAAHTTAAASSARRAGTRARGAASHQSGHKFLPMAEFALKFRYTRFVKSGPRSQGTTINTTAPPHRRTAGSPTTASRGKRHFARGRPNARLSIRPLPPTCDLP
jgi:hypothetical protein